MVRKVSAKFGAVAFAALLLVSCGDKAEKTAAADTTPVVPAPAGQDWTETVTETPEGGFLLGNPAAQVKLVEYGSMTCPHCADFGTNAMPQLREKYIKTGRVSLEFRNFVRDGMDVAASLLARCGGPEPFFKLTEQMFAGQKDWIQKAIDMPAAERDRMSKMPVADQLPTLAGITGLDRFVRQRGITDARVKACLNDQAAVDRLQKINRDAIDTYKIQGTPAFLINGELVEGVANWEALEPRIQAAIGG
jgi:protein-disulfide isomerase